MNEKNNLINMINQEKNNSNIFGKNLLNNVHKKIMNKVQNVEDDPEKLKIIENHLMNQKNKEEQHVPNKAELVIKADMKFRDSLKELSLALENLNDNEIAKKLIEEHLIMLTNIYNFFNSSNQ